MRKLLVGGALALALVAVPGVAGAQTSEEQSAEAAFVAKINALRAGKGLRELEVHPNLVDKARGWAATMAAAGRIWHSQLSDGITADWQKLGENVGVGGSVEGLHNAFVASPKHYENLVDPEFEYVGIGVVIVNGTTYVSENFMKLMPARAPKAPAPAPTPTTTAPAPAKPAAPPAPARPRPASTTTTTTAPAPVPAPVATPERAPEPLPVPAPPAPDPAPVANPEPAAPTPAPPAPAPSPSALPEPWLLLASVFGRARRLDG
jgi:hypothetical protein